jgi:hypothetical protein
MLADVQEVQRGFVAIGFAPRDDAAEIPAHVPDGDYEIPFRGRKVRVRVAGGRMDLSALATVTP